SKSVDIHKVNIYKLEPAAGAADALKLARMKKYQIVYWVVDEPVPEGYRKLRGWLQRHSAQGETLFPDGPVLGKPDYFRAANEIEFRRESLRALKKSFSGSIVAVASRPQDARAFQEVGLTTYLVGTAGEISKLVKGVKSWKEFAEWLH